MLFLALASLCSAVLTLVLKFFRDPKGNRFGIILGNYLTCVLIAFLQMQDRSQVFSVSSSTLLMSAVAGFLYVAGLVLTQTSVRINGATMTSAFSKLSLVVPLAVSFLFFDEIPSLLKIGGLVLAACAILLINSSGKEDAGAASGDEKKNLTLLLLTLLAVGCSETMTKIFSRFGGRIEYLCALLDIKKTPVGGGAYYHMEYDPARKDAIVDAERQKTHSYLEKGINLANDNHQ